MGEIIYLPVNDAFVMDTWQEDQEAENITVIPDGKGNCSAGMGMLVDKTEFGFNKRSWRYSMLVERRDDREDVHRTGCTRRPLRGLEYRHRHSINL